MGIPFTTTSRRGLARASLGLILALGVVVIGAAIDDERDGLRSDDGDGASPPLSGGASYEEFALPDPVRARQIALTQESAAGDPRYAMRALGGGFEASAGGELKARFDQDGVSFGVGEASARLEAASLECDGESRALSSATLSASEGQGNRVELSRHAEGIGLITEWYLSGTLGIEQGFDIDAPECESSVMLAMNARGAELTLRGDHISFRSGGSTLHYGELAVFDAEGRGLPSRLNLNGDQILLDVDVRGAAHPIVIDPLIFSGIQIAHDVEAPGLNPNKLFGHAIVVDGEFLIIGAPAVNYRGTTRAGGVFRYEYRAGGWRYVDAIEPPATDVGRRFGAAIKISGDTLAIGAPVGREVFIFTRRGRDWELHSRLSESDATSFGAALALEGDSLIVGSTGSAYLYKRGSDGEFSLSRRFEGSEDFGMALALSGDRLFIGGRQAEGADVRLYEGEGGDWSGAEPVAIVPSELQPAGRFGDALALHGDTLAIGAPGWRVPHSTDPETIHNNVGVVFVFERDGAGVWNEKAELPAMYRTAGQYCGEVVSIGADRIVWGCLQSKSGRGSVNLSERSAEGWLPTVEVMEGPGTSSRAGRRVELIGETLYTTVSASSDATWSGQVRIYTDPTPEGWTDYTSLILRSSTGIRDSRFGHAVALLGDRAVITAPTDRTDSSSHYGTPRVIIYERQSGRWEIDAIVEAETSGTSDRLLGASVAMEGDTILIGSTTLVIGRNSGTSGTYYQGQAIVLEKEWDEWIKRSPLVRPAPSIRNHYMGAAVALNEGIAVVAAPFTGRDPTTPIELDAESGEVYLFERIDEEWTLVTGLFSPSPTGRDHFGASVAKWGERVYVGSPRSEVLGVAGRGAVFVFVHRGERIWEYERTILASDGEEGDEFGRSLAIEGTTLLVGAPGASTERGVVYHYQLSGAGGERSESRLVDPDGRSGDRFGSSVAISGSYVLVGAPGHDSHPLEDSGRAFFFERLGGEFTLQESLTDEIPGAGAKFGGAVAVSESAILIGAPETTGYYERERQGRAIFYDLGGSGEPGASCERDEECASGICVQGVCCVDEACSGGDGGVWGTRDEPAAGLCSIGSPRSALAQLLGIGLALFVFAFMRRRSARGAGILLFALALSGLMSATASADASGESSEAESATASGDSEVIARAQFRLGEAYLLEGRFAQAGEAFEAAFAASGRPALLYNAYIAYRDGQELERAATTLRAYLAADPSQDTSLMRGRLAALEEEIARREEARAREEAERLAQERADEAEEGQATHEASGEAGAAEGWSAGAGSSRAESGGGRSLVLPIALIGGGAGVALIGFTTGGALLKHQRGRLDSYCGASAGLADGLCYDAPIVDEVGGKTAGLRGLAYGSLVAGAAIASVGLYFLFRGKREDRSVARALPTFECDWRQCSIGVVGSF